MAASVATLPTMEPSLVHQPRYRHLRELYRTPQQATRSRDMKGSPEVARVDMYKRRKAPVPETA